MNEFYVSVNFTGEEFKYKFPKAISFKEDDTWEAGVVDFHCSRIKGSTDWIEKDEIIFIEKLVRDAPQIQRNIRFFSKLLINSAWNHTLYNTDYFSKIDYVESSAKYQKKGNYPFQVNSWAIHNAILGDTYRTFASFDNPPTFTFYFDVKYKMSDIFQEIAIQINQHILETSQDIPENDVERDQLSVDQHIQFTISTLILAFTNEYKKAHLPEIGLDRKFGVLVLLADFVEGSCVKDKILRALFFKEFSQANHKSNHVCYFRVDKKFINECQFQVLNDALGSIVFDDKPCVKNLTAKPCDVSADCGTAAEKTTTKLAEAATRNTNTASVCVA